MNTKTLSKARKQAFWYSMCIECINGQYLGHVIEMPKVIGSGRTRQECLDSVEQSLLNRILLDIQNEKNLPAKYPEVGQDIYVNNSFSFDKEDFNGGLCEISHVEKEGDEYFVFIKERPGWRYAYSFLFRSQADFELQFGQNRGNKS